MNNLITWYIVLYLVELVLLIFLQIRAVKYLHVKEVTIGDVIVIFLIPAFIVVLPALFFCLFAGDISNTVIWRKK